MKMVSTTIQIGSFRASKKEEKNQEKIEKRREEKRREEIIKQALKVGETGEGRWNRSCELISAKKSVE